MVDEERRGHTREQTDESLRAERERVDGLVEKKREDIEHEADQVVQLARERADKVVQAARDEVDHERSSRRQTTASETSSERERSQADDVLQLERASADQVLERERAERRRVLADFLAVEREATDDDLIDERIHADTEIAARDAFLATVSHDLRSLLHGLSLNDALLVEHAPEGPDGDKARRHAATSKRLVARMNRLINDLLDVASIEAGKLGVTLEQVELADLLRDTLNAFESIAAAKQITIDVSCAEALCHAQLDGGRILQVLANLVSNAIKFTPVAGRISIQIGSEGNDLTFMVKDTGIGIPPDALETVFERFRQLSKDRRGLGLGLHISKSIVEAHGGRMWAESTLGVGTTIHFALPRR